MSPTIDFPMGGSTAGGVATAPPTKGSLTFYSYGRSDLATELTLSVLLAKVQAITEEDELSRSGVKSAPRSWREL